MNITVEPRQLKIFAVLCVLGVFSLITSAARDEKPKLTVAPTQTVETCMRDAYALALRGGLSNHHAEFLAGLKRTCEEMVAR